MTLYETFLKNPQEALRVSIDAHMKRSGFGPRRLFCYQSSLGVDGVRYGSFRNVAQEELDARTHKVEFWDGAVSIFWMDALYDPRARKMLAPPSIRPRDLPT